jgi:hypothetical protein
MALRTRYWFQSSEDLRCRRRCSVCGAHVAHGLVVERPLPCPVKRGCIGGTKALLVCDGCVDALREATFESDRPREPMRGCSCHSCKVRRQAYIDIETGVK